jgi:hypothetical protein
VEKKARQLKGQMKVCRTDKRLIHFPFKKAALGGKKSIFKGTTTQSIAAVTERRDEGACLARAFSVFGLGTPLISPPHTHTHTQLQQL